MNSEKIIKKHCFTIDQSNIEKFKNEVMQLNGIESVSTEANKLIINYDLRQNNYQTIKNHLSELSSIKTESILNRLQSSFISFRERNEINHMNNPTSWGYYVQNLYLSLHRNNHH